MIVWIQVYLLIGFMYFVACLFFPNVQAELKNTFDDPRFQAIIDVYGKSTFVLIYAICLVVFAGFACALFWPIFLILDLT